jgi:hypothetical protein
MKVQVVEMACRSKVVRAHTMGPCLELASCVGNYAVEAIQGLKFSAT